MKKVIFFSILIIFLCSSIAYSQGSGKNRSDSLNPDMFRPIPPVEPRGMEKKVKDFTEKREKRPHGSGWSEKIDKDDEKHDPIRGRGGAINIPLGGRKK